MSAPEPAAAPPAGPEPAASCPLCGGPNACAMAAPEGAEGACWCSAARIAPEALARLPERERGRRCICARCAGA